MTVQHLILYTDSVWHNAHGQRTLWCIPRTDPTVCSTIG